MHYKSFSVAWLRENLRYDPSTGYLWWILPGCKRSLTRPVGHLGQGYVEFRLGGTQFKAHRVIWALVTGEWPREQIDHKNMNRSDNRWCNLREATFAQNRQNRRCYRNSSCGLKGVTWHKGEKKWRAQIQVNKKRRIIGRYDTPEKAYRAYVREANRLFKEYARMA